MHGHSDLKVNDLWLILKIIHDVVYNFSANELNETVTCMTLLNDNTILNGALFAKENERYSKL